MKSTEYKLSPSAVRLAHPACGKAYSGCRGIWHSRASLGLRICQRLPAPDQKKSSACDTRERGCWDRTNCRHSVKHLSLESSICNSVLGAKGVMLFSRSTRHF